MDNQSITNPEKHSKFLAKEQVLAIFSSLLILLWVYTALSKLVDIDEFERELKGQVFGQAASAFLLWLLPLVELLAATLLLFSNTKRMGFFLSTALMAIFTGYIILVLSGYYHKTPCSCGGVLRVMGWQAHLWFNLFFLLISAAGTWFARPGIPSRSKPYHQPPG